MPETEEWLPVVGFPDYRVSDQGRVASVKRGEFRVLAGGKTQMGYRSVLLYTGGDRKSFRVHALVAAAFHGPRPEGLQIRHLDGDQLNNAASNLKYGTAAENYEDMRRHRGRLLIVGTDPVPTRYMERSPRVKRGPSRLDAHRSHLTDESSIYRYPDGRAVCRTCKTATEVASRGRRRQAAALRAASVPSAVAA